MLKKAVYQVLRHRHFWREAGFDELSELYVSIMFRGLSISLTGLFVPLYMLGLEYSLTSILMVIAWYFTFRIFFCDIASAFTVARIGPKHTMLIGYSLLTISTAMFLCLTQIAWPLWLLGGIWGASASFFFIPFNVDFSKVKHSRYGGRELGYVNIMEKVGSAAGPLIGGLIATVFGPQYIFLAATILLVIGIIPLLRTAEPVKTRQKLDFSSLKIDNLKRDFISVSALGIENSLTMFLWPLYLGFFVVAGATAYAKLGILWSVSLCAAILAAHIIGKLIDTHRGRKLLKVSAGINAVLHLLRPLVKSYPVAFGINVVNDIVTVGYRMPYYKGLFDAADNLPGYRIVYLTSIEFISSVCKGTVWWLMVLLASVMNPQALFVTGFSIAALASILITSERFKALDPVYNKNNHG